MKRRTFVTGLASGLGPMARRADAQSPRHVGWLAIVSVPPDLDAFRHGMRALGHVEGSTFTLEQRYAGAHTGPRFEELAGELARLKVDVIATTGTAATAAARKSASTIPVVFVTGGDPVGHGFVKSLPHPGGMLTGVTTTQAPEINGKRMQILKEAVPGMKRLAILLDDSGATLPSPSREGTNRMCRDLGMSPVPLSVRTTEDLDTAFARGIRERAAGILVLSSPFFHANRQRVTGLAARHRLPAIYEHRNFVDVGGLMSYGFDIGEVFRRMASYIDRILKGARPADLPVEQLARIELVINVKTSAALGLSLPPSLVARADRVVE